MSLPAAFKKAAEWNKQNSSAQPVKASPQVSKKKLISSMGRVITITETHSSMWEMLKEWIAGG